MHAFFAIIFTCLCIYIKGRGVFFSLTKKKRKSSLCQKNDARDKKIKKGTDLFSLKRTDLSLF